MKRFIGPRDHEVQKMLKVCGARDLDHLVDLIVPQQIQDKNALSYGDVPLLINKFLVSCRNVRIEYNGAYEINIREE